MEGMPGEGVDLAKPYYYIKDPPISGFCFPAVHSDGVQGRVGSARIRRACGAYPFLCTMTFFTDSALEAWLRHRPAEFVGTMIDPGPVHLNSSRVNSWHTGQA